MAFLLSRSRFVPRNLFFATTSQAPTLHLSTATPNTNRNNNKINELKHITDPERLEHPRRRTMSTHSFVISTGWNNAPLSEKDHVNLMLSSDPNGIHVSFTAPFYNDKKPDHPPGSMMHLWDYEVVEIFFLGKDNKYLEIELGPHGHYLGLELEGVRNVVKQELPLDVTLDHLDDGMWHSSVVIPRSYLPKDIEKFNAYSIHGEGENRRYNALFPVTTSDSDNQPDFHKLEWFQLLPEDLR
eukprot:m.27699 g.27699  ORF g.27699 m.27699 type:complete len:241 (-) comp5970_c0_seq1:157-879(-)